MFLQILRLMMSSQPVERNPTPTQCSSELNKVAIIIPNYSTACMTYVHCVTVAGTPAEYSPRDIPHSYFMKRRNATTITHQELIQDILALIQVDGARKKVSSLKGPIASVLPPEKPSSPEHRYPEIVSLLL